VEFQGLIPKSTGLDGCLDEIDVGFVEREATPRLLMTLRIQLHLTGLSLSNTVSILEVFGSTFELFQSRQHRNC
jgi:hypothetical protein